MKLFSVLSSTFLLFLVFPSAAFSQMFSVDNSGPRADRPLGQYTMLGVSWEMAVFDYTGSEAPAEDRLDFDSSILRLRLDSPGLDLNLGFGGSLTGMDENSYVNILGRLYNDFSVVREPSFQLFIPLQLTTDLKRVQREDSEAEFRQSSLSLGSGLASMVRLGRRLDLTLRATPNYGFSFSQGALFGGNLFKFDGKTLFIFRNLFGNNGLAVGYHFDYRSYDIEEDLNDYNYTSHSVTVGFTF